MEISNARMQRLVDAHRMTHVTLAPQLAEIVNQGFVQAHGCYILGYFRHLSPHVKVDDFVDLTGYECFVNGFHVDDFVQEDLLAQALAFSEAVLSKWKQAQFKEVLEVVIGETETGFNIKVHVQRNGELWIDPQDLENFDEGLMLVRSDLEV